MVDVAGSNPVSRSIYFALVRQLAGAGAFLWLRFPKSAEASTIDSSIPVLGLPQTCNRATPYTNTDSYVHETRLGKLLSGPFSYPSARALRPASGAGVIRVAGETLCANRFTKRTGTPRHSGRFAFHTKRGLPEGRPLKSKLRPRQGVRCWRSVRRAGAAPGAHPPA